MLNDLDSGEIGFAPTGDHYSSSGAEYAANRATNLMVSILEAEVEEDLSDDIVVALALCDPYIFKGFLDMCPQHTGLYAKAAVKGGILLRRELAWNTRVEYVKEKDYLTYYLLAQESGSSFLSESMLVRISNLNVK